MTEYFIIDEHTNFYLESGAAIVALELKELIKYLPDDKKPVLTELIEKLDWSADIHSGMLECLWEHDKKEKEMFYISMNNLIEKYGVEEMARLVKRKVVENRIRNTEEAKQLQELHEEGKAYHSKNTLDDLFGD